MLGPDAGVEDADDDVLAGLAGPPRRLQRPVPAASRPRKCGVDDVLGWSRRSRETETTPGCSRSLAAWASLISAAKPLKANL